MTEISVAEQRYKAVLAVIADGQHTRVGGILLISAGIETTAGGSLWKQYSHGIIKPHAAIPLPEWIRAEVSGG